MTVVEKLACAFDDLSAVLTVLTERDQAWYDLHFIQNNLRKAREVIPRKLLNYELRVQK